MYLEVVGPGVAHAALDAAREVLEHELERADEGDVALDSLRAEGLRVDLAASLVLLGHVRPH